LRGRRREERHRLRLRQRLAGATRPRIEERAQVGELAGERAHVGGPPGRLLAQAPGQQALEGHGQAQPRPNRGDRRRRVVEVLRQELHQRLPFEGRPPGQHLVEHDAQRVDVGPPVDGVAHDLLGRHVLRRAQDLAGARHRRPLAVVEELGDAEIEHAREVLAPGALGEDDVVRLEVAVNDAVCVCVGQRRRDLLGDVDGTEGCQRGLARDDVAQADAGDQLHGDEQDAALVLAEVEERHRVRMRQSRHHLGLGLEATQELRVGEHRRSSTLSAISRFTETCSARNTVPMPPAPSLESTR
jgi:hypothetical protein